MMGKRVSAAVGVLLIVLAALIVMLFVWKLWDKFL